MTDQSSSPSIETPRLSSCEISDLSDADLEEIFKHLPPVDRLLTSLVCKRWLAISRRPWRDVRHLEPDRRFGTGDYTAAIIRQCPNLRTVFAMTVFRLNELNGLARIPLVSVTMFHCFCPIGFSSFEYDGWVNDAFSAVFSTALANANWQELTMRGVRLTISDAESMHEMQTSFPATALPASLKRLQLADVTSACDNRCYFPEPTAGGLHEGLDRLQQLECLILNDTADEWNSRYCCVAQALCASTVYANMGALRNLRELRLGSSVVFTPLLGPIFGLTSLEVLFLHNVRLRDENSIDLFAEFFTGHPSLRILFVSGQLSLLMEDVEMDVELSPRRRYPNGLGSAPLPLLHIFLENEVFQSEKITFPGAFDCAQIHQIDGDYPLAAFFEKEGIKPIFEGVWMTQKIKEAFEFGVRVFERPSPSF